MLPPYTYEILISVSLCASIPSRSSNFSQDGQYGAIVLGGDYEVEEGKTVTPRVKVSCHLSMVLLSLSLFHLVYLTNER